MIFEGKAVLNNLEIKEYKTTTNIILDFKQKSFIHMFKLSLRYTYHL